MVKFARLRLNGFKSFADRTDLDIQAGLTGIVGPNGCGKSNLVEALRWVMGANNARLLRGEHMDDVIFAGTSRRPSRNHAEVSIVLDNSGGGAPGPYNMAPEIEITRRIDRDQGSGYTINSRAVRARDVQTLFADLTSGASSAAMVGQGKVTSIINARPIDRRTLLEEAAGVSGLYARRQEAEQRLKAAEENMNRLQETIDRLEGQAGHLKRQARQASRYRELSDEIKKLEQQIAMIQWTQAVATSLAASQAYREAERMVAEQLRTVLQLQQTADTMAEGIKPLQIKAAESKASLQTLVITRQQKRDEQARLSRDGEAITAQLTQLVADEAHETALLDELETLSGQLARETETLNTSLSGYADRRVAAEDAIAAARAAAQKATQAYQDVLAEQARLQARTNDLAASIAREERRLAQLHDRQAALIAKGEQQEGDSEQAELTKLEDDAKTVADRVTAIGAQEEKSIAAIAAFRTKLEDARKDQKAARERETQVEFEIKALEKALAALENGKDGKARPVLSDISVTDGFEMALARALGETLQAPLNGSGDHGWRDLGGSPEFLAWPDGVTPLADVVKAPPALNRALQMAGVLNDGADAETLQARLQPGQVLVSRDGFIWRWDGYTSRRTAADQAAIVLQQKTRLAELTAQLPKEVKARETADTALAKVETEMSREESGMGTLRQERLDLEGKLRATQQKIHSIRSALSRIEAEKQANVAAKASVQEDITLATEQLNELREQQAALFSDDNAVGLPEQLEKLGYAQENANETLQDAVTKGQMLEADEQRQKARLQAIGDDRLSAQNRQIRAKDQLSRISHRRGELQKQQNELAGLPAKLIEEIAALDDKITGHDRDTAAIAEKLSGAEAELSSVNASLRAAETIMTQARENAARLGERSQTAEERKFEITERITDTFGQSPLTMEQAEDYASMKEGPLAAEREKLSRARDALGPVNLLAERECDEILAELEKLVTERDDLIQAVAELRQAVGKLNGEARERLNASFVAINTHFERLFRQLFGGGVARLALVDSDDPLAAGLEIFAQPPGKALQSLSLLSGGEQTLTAVALIFAMFLTNPAPLCVLDEIDAPLDDANVDRVCDLLEQISNEGITRFLIITHHRLTMARMHRLYGVTMAEQGISQLVSLELQSQFKFSEAA
jgi:chromosome segregation protein